MKTQSVSELRKLAKFARKCRFLSALLLILLSCGAIALVLSPIKFYGALLFIFVLNCTYFGTKLLRRLDTRMRSLYKLEIPQWPTHQQLHQLQKH